MEFSDLQISLAGAGVILVAVVWSYNLYQERKHRQAAERIFSEQRHTVQEDVSADGSLQGEEASFARVEPVIAQADEDAPSAVQETEDSAVTEPDDDLVDAYMELVFAVDTPRAISFDRIRELCATSSSEPNRPRRILVDGGKGWQELGQEDGETCHLRLLLQLADRRGAATAAEINALAVALNRLAESAGGDLQPVNVASAAAAAAMLDERCAATDVQIALHLVHVSGGKFATEFVASCLVEAGLVLAQDGNFHLKDEQGNTRFSVTADGAVPFADKEVPALLDGIAFWLDVPRVKEGQHVFEQMAALAASCGSKLGGTIVDDQKRALSKPELAGIAGKIAEIQQVMADSGMPAGGKRALRLFA